MPQDFSAGTENLLAEAGWNCGGNHIPRKGPQPERFGSEDSGQAAGVRRWPPSNQENLFIGP